MPANQSADSARSNELQNDTYPVRDDAAGGTPEQALTDSAEMPIRRRGDR